MIVEQQCEHCHTTFTRERKPGGREARFCSDRCRVAANRNRNRTTPTGDDGMFPQVELVTIASTGQDPESVTFASVDQTAVVVEDVPKTVTIASADGLVADPCHSWTGLLIRLDVAYKEISPEWFAQQRAIFVQRGGTL